jgi:hypothetical protein
MTLMKRLRRRKAMLSRKMKRAMGVVGGSTRAALTALGNVDAFPSFGRVERRWGQILREPLEIQAFLANARARGSLVALAELAELQGGVVTRANAYFIVRELSFEKVPTRFHLTKRDYRRVAVIADGLETLHVCERHYLRPVIKGPESLEGPTKIAVTDRRLFDVQDKSKEELRRLRANGALAYLRRGETTRYKMSDDRLKGGIPAQRSNIKNRKPHWYSLHTHATDVSRIVVPEHFDTRYIATLLGPDEPSIVIDKLYLVVAKQEEDVEVLLLSLNSLLTWYQLELRGRTQLGQGVLEVKKTDWEGVLVLNPRTLRANTRKRLVEQFLPLRGTPGLATGEELTRMERARFDSGHLAAAGAAEPDDFRTLVERELRAAINEREERAKSLTQERERRFTGRRVTASIDAYASKIAAGLEPFPDPRAFVEPGPPAMMIAILGPVEGLVTIGDDLFTFGEVFAGDTRIASTGDLQSAEFVRGVLIHEPDVEAIALPEAPILKKAIEVWHDAIRDWYAKFEEHCKGIVAPIADPRLRSEIRERALMLLHAVVGL